LFAQAQSLIRRFERVDLRHVRREQNARTDALCNRVLDGKPSARSASASSSATSPSREDGLRADAVTCLKSAAATWARGNAADPSPELVWEQLWSLVVEAGLVKKAR